MFYAALEYRFLSGKGFSIREELSPKVLLNLRLVNKRFNCVGTRLLFQCFDASMNMKAWPDRSLEALRELVEAGYGHHVRKLRLGNPPDEWETYYQDVLEYVEELAYYFPNLFRQLTGLQSLHIEYLSPSNLRKAFIDTILKAFDTPPPTLKALSISFNAISEESVPSRLDHGAMSRFMPQIRYLRICFQIGLVSVADLFDYNDNLPSACEFIKYGENLRHVELQGLDDIRDVSLCHFHPKAPLQHVVLNRMHLSVQDVLRFLRTYRQTLTVVTFDSVILLDGTWKEIYEELDALPLISVWEVYCCHPSMTSWVCEDRSGPRNQKIRSGRRTPLVFW